MLIPWDGGLGERMYLVFEIKLQIINSLLLPERKEGKLSQCFSFLLNEEMIIFELRKDEKKGIAN